MSDERLPVLYLAPWVDFGGSDKGTVDWFRWLDRSRFAPSLITTQPSPNRRLAEVAPYAEEVWALPELLPGRRFAELIVDFIVSRGIEVLHVMNSRLGFDLLPDLRTLERPPKVVVQLHVEEDTRDGYVRYVTTRYGNLVDAFSLSSRHLADAVHDDYGVSRDRIWMIPTGVDAESEFSPATVSPTPGLEPGLAHILYPARLAPQKDPLTMVEVARELRARELAFRIHVLGEGELEPAVRERVAALGLEQQVRLHPPTSEPAPWYAAADLMLMTSAFEGMPYVLYEALAMGVPAVVPALPGTVELLGGPAGARGGVLIEARADPGAYADALAALIADPDARRRIGSEGRAHVRSRFTLAEMAARHGELYEQLAVARRRQLGAEAERPGDGVAQAPEPIVLAARPAGGTPLVSVIIPCFNHGRFLRECLDSVRAQTYPALEMVVVDDGSTESETVAIIDQLESAAAPELTVVRLERNMGPSAARNRGIERARGRFILPLDADNLLFPDSLELLVSQLQGAGADIGFVYPVIRYFGNREDLFQPPDYNLWLLAQGNYIDTCALIDREVFDHGIRYDEDIVLGHEDWDFFLTLGERGVIGEPARAPTLRYRKRGFTRSDLVDTAGDRFPEEIRRRHPALFGRLDRIKARWSPAMTIVALAPVEVGSGAWQKVIDGVGAQRFSDFELLAATDSDLEDTGASPRIGSLPAALRGRYGETVAHVLELTPAPLVMITYGTGEELLRDPGGIEKLARLLEHGSGSGLVAFTDRPAPGRHPWAPIDASVPGLETDALAWARHAPELRRLPGGLDSGEPLGHLARWHQVQRISVEWRHLPREAPHGAVPSGRLVAIEEVPRSRSELSERHARLDAKVRLAGAGATVLRWRRLEEWAPPGTVPVFRHRRSEASEWKVTRDRQPPQWYVHERVLGVMHKTGLEGTARIVTDPEHGWRAVELGTLPDPVEMDRTLGYADQMPFPLLDALVVCRHAATGLPVLICGENDPLRNEVEWPPLTVLGWIDPLPVNPKSGPVPGETLGWLRGIVRTLDAEAHRHRVGLGSVPAGEAAWELGALPDRDPGHGIPAWAQDGWLVTGEYVPRAAPFSPRRALRWTAAPSGWGELADAGERARAVLRRTRDAGRGLAGRSGAEAPDRPPDGWLLRENGPDRVPVISAIHPVTGDQLLTRDPSEVYDLGYEAPRVIGCALRLAPVTGSLGTRPEVLVPWAEQFGLGTRNSEDPLELDD